ncbi:hypothetical protein KCU83_g4073, partial [Aureobasidium melanogenum]
MKSAAVVAFAAAAMVAPTLAQDAASLAALLPSCAVNCALTAIPATGCTATDVSCLCSSSSFISSIASCTQGACSAEDQAKTAAATAQICPNLAGAASAVSSYISSSVAASSASMVASSSVASVISSASSSVKASAVAPIATASTVPTVNLTTNGTVPVATTSMPASYTGAASAVSAGLGLLAIMGFAAL